MRTPAPESTSSQALADPPDDVVERLASAPRATAVDAGHRPDDVRRRREQAFAAAAVGHDDQPDLGLA